MTIEEVKCQLGDFEACTQALGSVLDAVSEVDDVVGRPGEPCPVASQGAIRRIRHIIAGLEKSICGKRDAQGADNG